MKIKIKELQDEILKEIESLPLDEKVEALNYLRETLHQVSPFKGEPVDFVKWIKCEQANPNNYNPNKVAKPEMELLYTSIKSYGIGFPIITGKETDTSEYTIVDGFHRHLTVSNRQDINQRLFGYLPIAILDLSEEQLIAATVAFNKAKGKNEVELMANLLGLLTSKGLTNLEIATVLGMESEEILRLKQTIGIAQILANKQYDKAWVLADKKNSEM